MNNDELNIKKEDSLSNATPIRKISSINRNLWEEVEKYRNKQEEDSIDFSYEDNEKSVEEKPRQKKLGTAAFTSISIMALTTTVVSIGIVILGIMVLN